MIIIYLTVSNLEVKEIRKKLGKTQKELADLLGVSLRAVQSWESGERNISQSAYLLLKNILENRFSDKDRIQSILDHLKISANAFSEEIGLTSNVSVYHIMNERNNISPSFAKKVTDRYPEINYKWLKNGEGEMLITQGNKVNKLYEPKFAERIIEEQEIPYYDIEATAGVVTLFKDPTSRTPVDTIKIPNMPNCDGAIAITGDSMYPLVKSGDIVFYKTINDVPDSIFYGNMYIVSLDIEGDELVMLKYIQKGSDNDHLLLVSENRHHADKEIHIKHINGIALVKGNIRFNFLT